MTLVGVAPEYPTIGYDVVLETGALTYDPGTQNFDVRATPLNFRTAPDFFSLFSVDDPRDFQLHIKVDNAGNLAGGASGADLQIRGVIDTTDDDVDNPDYSGLLLSGEVTKFGWRDNAQADDFDFVFTPTGGALLNFYAGKDIGVVLQSLPLAPYTPFAGSFTTAFGGGAQGTVGTIPHRADSAPATLAGRVYCDEGVDGTDGGGADQGIAGVTVTVTRKSDGAVIATKQTASDGSYSFAGLQGGETYVITESQPADHFDAADNVGAFGEVGPHVNDSFTVAVPAAGGTAGGYNFGELLKATVSGYVYHDADNNGSQGAGEPGVAGVTLTLTGSDDQNNPVSVSAVTDSAGFYKIENVRPAKAGTSYTLTETQPAGYLHGAEHQGNVVLFTLDGCKNFDANFSELLPFSISGRKYDDRTGDGITPADDTGLAGVTINLYQGTSATGALVTSTVTGPGGAYSFGGLIPGNSYFVQEVAPANSVQTGGNAGYVIVATSGGNSTGNDFANFRKGRITGTKFTDRTGDGFGNGDAPLGGVTINLYANNSPSGAPIATKVTADDGTYSFDSLEPGTYFVQEVVPAGYQQTGGSAGYVVIVGPGGIVSGGTSANNDFANFKTITISGTKSTDLTGNGFSGDDTPLAGVTIKLFRESDATPGLSAGDAAAGSTTTAADGSFSFADLGPGTYYVQEVVPIGYQQTGGPAYYAVSAGGTVNVGDRNFANFKKITISGTKFTDISGNSFSADDTPLGGVTVNLFKDGGATPVATAVTDGNGKYSFPDLGPGTYFVQEVVPDGSVQTGGTAGYTIPAVSGQDVSGKNFANFKKITISGRKYNDRTGNGILGADDTGLGGVTIKLFKDANGDGVLTAADGAAIASAVTGTDGTFAFPDLGPGTYFVQEVVPPGSVQTVGPSYYTVVAASGQDASGKDFANFAKIMISGTKYNDLTGNSFSKDDRPRAGVTINLYAGDAPVGTPIASAVTADDGSFSFLNVGPGTYFVQEVVPADSIQTGGNAGYVIVATSGTNSTGNNFANFQKGRITGKKSTDLTGNSFSTDDTPLDGVTINLYAGSNANGPVIATTTTAGGGNYAFDNLAPGTYFVQEVVPAGYQQTGGNAGYVVTIGGDGGVVSGGTAAGKDFDNFQKGKITGRKVTDLTGDGVTGDDTGLGGVTINLYAGTSASGALVATTTTADNGSYAFDHLAIGTYFVQEVVPGGYQQTAGNAGYVVTVGPGGLASGGTSADNNFANFKKITISGTKYRDITGNSFSKDDTPLGGVTIQLFKDGGATPVTTAVTADDGSYAFANLGPGTYFVQEVVPAGYAQTGGTAGYTIPAASGQDASGKDFDNVLLTPGIDLEKTTNGPTNSNPVAPDYDNEDAMNGPGVPVLTPGSTVTWTYQVTNTGNVPYTAAQIALVDDNGTPGDTGDDLSIANRKITFLSYQTGDSDGLLEPGEVWVYQATGTVRDLGTAGGGTSATFDFNGSSALDGAAGNVRTFTAGGVTVNASAFGRNKASGAWSTAWLGSYPGGLGVTDAADGGGANNMHTVDNLGSDNYVLFEFSQAVVPDAAFLGYVVGDSDLKVWIGNVPNAFNSHQTLSDAFLAGLGFTEVNLTDLTTTRTADFNAGNVSGNVLVIAADPGDATPDDRFKIQTLTVKKPGVGGVYENKATVTVPGAADSDLSHYRNPARASVGDYVFQDCNGNGVQDAGESPVAGVTVKLLDGGGNVVGTTTTNASGLYLFSGLAAGTYSVQFVAPAGYAFTAADQGGNDAKDSDANPTTGRTANFTLAAGQTDLTRDAGLYQPASLSGSVYSDLDDDGIKESGEPGIGGVTLKLLNGSGAVISTTTTSSSGAYSFTGLAPGTYTVAETQPAGYADGDDTVGTVNGVKVGAAPSTDNDTLTTIALKCADAGVNYNFGELGIFRGLTATIGFWHNKNGQALLNSFGTTANGLTLGNWLAVNMPNLFGKNAPALTTTSTRGANLTGKTNAQVAAYFMQLFGVTGQKSYAQVLATAFAVFTTTNSLNTGATSRSLAAKHGFVLSNTGAGAASINVGANGAAFGLANNATTSVLDLLLRANARAVGGVLNNGNTTYITMTNNMFDLINNQGDIGVGMALVSADATSVGAVGTLGRIFAGTYLVSIDSLVSAAQDARVQDAIARLNAALGAYGISLAAVPQGVTASADIQLLLADTTAIGGAADGVLGLTELGGLVTIVNGWDYYLGGDAAGIGGGQYDFETVVMHELGHALGLGHSEDADSVMFGSLGAGQSRRELTRNDLALLGHVDEADDAAPEALRATAPANGKSDGKASAARHGRGGTASNGKALPAAAASASPFSSSRVSARRLADDVLVGTHGGSDLF